MNAHLVAGGWTVGHSDTNGDAFDVRRSTDGTGCRLRVAVADGASTTLFAGMWARALVTSALGGWTDLSDGEVTERLEVERDQFSPPIDGADRFVTRKWANMGSQATLVAATIVSRRGTVELNAVAVGDSEVVVVGSSTCAFFPIVRSQDFNSNPELITTRAGDAIALRRWSRSIAPGDLVLLASDAVAHRLLRLHEALGRPGIVSALRELVVGETGLEEALALAGDGPLDDDLTLVVCGVAPNVGDDLDVLRALLQPSPEPRRPATGITDRLLRFFTKKRS